MDKIDYDELFKLRVKAFEKHKNQTYVDRLRQEGKIEAYKSIKNTIIMTAKLNYLNKKKKLKSYKSDEDELKKFNLSKELSKGNKVTEMTYNKVSNELSSLERDLSIFIAQERIYEKLNIDIEVSLNSMDYSSIEKKDPIWKIERIKENKCCFKRPSVRGMFPCDKEIVDGSAYCKTHLKQFDPIKYLDIFDNDETIDTDLE